MEPKWNQTGTRAEPEIKTAHFGVFYINIKWYMVNNIFLPLCGSTGKYYFYYEKNWKFLWIT